MKYLLDANTWLDLILGRAGRDEVQLLLNTVPNRLLVMTDFALHTAGIYTARRSPDVYLRFIEDLIRNEIGVLHIPPTALRDVVKTMTEFSLTFDDAFQYVAGVRFDLTLVSFDSDFDKTPRGRITPAKAVELWTAEQARPPR
jgi:predicted nucleic acid-binding protein